MLCRILFVVMLNVFMLCLYAECCYAECRYTECRGAFMGKAVAVFTTLHFLCNLRMGPISESGQAFPA